LEKQLGIKESIIEDLIGLQEIVETEELKKPIMLSLNHSSIADLYYKAYQITPIRRRIKVKILNQEDGKDFEYSSFNQYITTTDPRNSVNVFIYLSRDWLDKKGGITLLKSLIEDEKYSNILKL